MGNGKRHIRSSLQIIFIISIHLFAFPSWHFQKTPQSSGSAKVPQSLGQLVVEIGSSSSVLSPHSTRWSSSHCSTLYSSSSIKANPFPQVLSSAIPSRQAQYLSQLRWNKMIKINFWWKGKDETLFLWVAQTFNLWCWLPKCSWVAQHELWVMSTIFTSKYTDL